MVVRLVKMTFRPEEVTRFQELFVGWREKIIAFPGCARLELLHDTEDPGVFFTYSAWNDPMDLEAYRNSEVFGNVWPVVKQLFAEPAEAWTLDREHNMIHSPGSE